MVVCNLCVSYLCVCLLNAFAISVGYVISL